MFKSTYVVKWKDVTRFVEGIDFKGITFDRIICIHRGGLPLGVMLSHRLNLPLDISYITRYDKLSHYISREEIIKRNIEGNDILIVDDISDSGITLKKLYEVVQKKGAKSITTISYAIKNQTKFTPTYYKVVVPQDRWVVFPWEIKRDDSNDDKKTKRKKA